MSAPKTCHSATVTLTLVIEDREIPLSQAAHDFAIVRDFVELPPCDAELEMVIDGHVDRVSVRLPQGCRAGERRIQIKAPCLDRVAVDQARGD
jgi:hypothetical protein